MKRKTPQRRLYQQYFDKNGQIGSLPLTTMGEAISKRVEGVVVLPEGTFLPHARISYLHFLMSHQGIDKKQRDRAIRSMYDAGLLSTNREGNYSVEGGFLGNGNGSFNPCLEGKQLYFVLEGDALDFANRSRLPVDFVRRHEGEVNLPEELNLDHWGVLRLKVDEELKDRLKKLLVDETSEQCLMFPIAERRMRAGYIKELLRKGVLTRDSAQGVSVVCRLSSTSETEHSMNIRDERGDLFFTGGPAARAYRDSLCCLANKFGKGNSGVFEVREN